MVTSRNFLIAVFFLILLCLTQSELQAAILMSGKIIVVNSTSDSGPGSLREAIEKAIPRDSIIFDASVFPPTDPDTINLLSELPHISQGNLIIDASKAGVIIDGSHIPSTELANGLFIASEYNTIRGLQITNFSDAGIALVDDSHYNKIGGNRNIGSTILGQGNLICGNGNLGININGVNTSNNIIQGNIIGTDLSGTRDLGGSMDGIHCAGGTENIITGNMIVGYGQNGIAIYGPQGGHNTVENNLIGTNSGEVSNLGNGYHGINIDNSGHNIIGPGNIIAYNGRAGISIMGELAVGNHVTRNSIYNNQGMEIELCYGGNKNIAAPYLLDFDKQAGFVNGAACANCTIEVFSGNKGNGKIYEGQTLADNNGYFSFFKNEAFENPNLIATATDSIGNTSQFSVYTPELPGRTINLQEGNTLPLTQVQTYPSDELADNHIGGGHGINWILESGVKRATCSTTEGEWCLVDWTIPEFEVSDWQENFVTTLAANGLMITIVMVFWDKTNHPDRWIEEENTEGYSRFQTEEEIQRYLEFVRFNVNQFKDRAEYFELWTEPDNGGFPVQYIKVPDYIKLVKRVVPVIREIDPEAKIEVGGISRLACARDWLFGILKSDEVMPLVDVVYWGAFYGESPAHEEWSDYYYQYPSIVQDIKDTASANGFSGEYKATVSWGIDELAMPEGLIVSDIQSAKYLARSIIIHLDMGINIDTGDGEPERVTYSIIKNLCTVMAGAKTDSIPMEIQTTVSELRSCSFSLDNGDKLYAVWNDNIAVDYDPGVASKLIIPGLTNQRMIGIDVLNGYEQELITEIQDSNMIIQDFMIKDYPIILRTSSPTGINIPEKSEPFKLNQNYPNPFKDQTTITYELREDARVSLKVYNIYGQLIETAVNEYKTAGLHKYIWNAGNIKPGVYFYQIETDEYRDTKLCLKYK